MIDLNKKLNLIQGDCLDVLKQLPDKSIDLILTDPPYGINLEYNSYKDNEENWFALMDKFIPEARRVAKMVIFPCCQIARLDWYYINHKPDWLIAWYKGSPGQRSYVGFSDWEPLIVYGKNEGIQMHDYFYCRPNESMGNFNHPCPKPVEWNEWIIKRASKEGDIIMDCFMGSGTCGLATFKVGGNRKFLGVELDKDYFETSIQRINQWKEQTRLF